MHGATIKMSTECMFVPGEVEGIWQKVMVSCLSVVCHVLEVSHNSKENRN
jgi:hypothetical protein